MGARQQDSAQSFEVIICFSKMFSFAIPVSLIREPEDVVLDMESIFKMATESLVRAFFCAQAFAARQKRSFFSWKGPIKSPTVD